MILSCCYCCCLMILSYYLNCCSNYCGMKKENCNYYCSNYAKAMNTKVLSLNCSAMALQYWMMTATSCWVRCSCLTNAYCCSYYSLHLNSTNSVRWYVLYRRLMELPMMTVSRYCYLPHFLLYVWWW